MTRLGRVPLLAMRICAARHEPKVGDVEFVDLVREFEGAVVEDSLGDDRSSSMGAAEADSNAEQVTVKAATETSAAPSNSAPSDSCRREAEPTPAPLLDGLSPYGQPATRSRSGRVLPEKSGNTKRVGAPPKLSDETKLKIAADYLAARAGNGGETPKGWGKDQATAYDVNVQTIYRSIEVAQSELLTAKAGGEAKARRPTHAQGMREHTHASECWCRRLPANQWCALSHLPPALNKPVSREDRARFVRRLAEVE